MKPATGLTIIPNTAQACSPVPATHSRQGPQSTQQPWAGDDASFTHGAKGSGWQLHPKTRSHDRGLGKGRQQGWVGLKALGRLPGDSPLSHDSKAQLRAPGWEGEVAAWPLTPL